MRSIATLLLLLATIIPAAPHSLTVLLLPPPSLSTDGDAHNAVVASLTIVWRKTVGNWSVAIFHGESPSIQRAKREGKLSPDALANPHEHAAELCIIEGAKAALWLRVSKAEGKIPQAIEAKLLFPVIARFETDLSEAPVTEEEKRILRAISLKTSPPPEMVLALRLGQWLKEQLSSFLEAESQITVPDLETAKSLIEKGKWDEAIQVISRMISISPQNPSLYLLLGQAYEGQRKWEDAFLEYRRAAQLQPDLIDAQKGIARVAAQRNRWDLVLTAVRQIRKKGADIEPIYLALGAKAATNLASSAWLRGRDEEAEMLRKEATELDILLLQIVTEPKMLLEAAERLRSNGKFNLAAEALTKTVTQSSFDPSIADRILKLAWLLERSDLILQFLSRTVSQKSSWTPSQDVFRIVAQVLDTKAVKLFEQVRDNLASFDASKLTRDDLLSQLQKINAEAEQLLNAALAIQAPEFFAKTHNRRLLSYELFLQATTLLLQWVEQPNDLIRRRSVVLYEFARTELEQTWKEEQRLR